MKLVKQTQIHIEGVQNGDCWRACLASILECPIDTFPIQSIDEMWGDYYIKIYNILYSMGYDIQG